MTQYPSCPLCYGDMEVTNRPISKTDIRDKQGYECMTAGCEAFSEFVYPEDVRWQENEKCHCIGSCVC